MIFLLDTSEDHDVCAEELGVESHDVGQLITPAPGFSNRDRKFWAIDNGGFKRQDAGAFFRIVKREEHRKAEALFVALPDVVCNARRTLELFGHFYPRLHGWRKALVLQNGIEHHAIPWDLIDAVFIGGDDPFKGCDEVRQTVAAAKWLGKWVHMGRVNTPQRVQLAEEMGCDSVDGTGIAKYTHMRRAIAMGTEALVF